MTKTEEFKGNWMLSEPTVYNKHAASGSIVSISLSNVALNSTLLLNLNSTLI